MSTTPIPPEMRAEVIDRDGIDCLRCGTPVQRHLDGRVRPDTLAFDHVWPEHLGGPTIVRNLQVLCTLCNRAKGATHADYRTAPIVGGAWHPSEARPQRRMSRRKRRAEAERLVLAERWEREQEERVVAMVQAGIEGLDIDEQCALIEAEAARPNPYGLC
jgi:hypothetical protein